MRVIATIPHPDMRISIFHMNDKYIVKFEAGPMEQTFKFNQDEIGGLDQLTASLTPEFIK